MITRRRFLGAAALTAASVALGSLPAIGEAIVGQPTQTPSNLPMPPDSPSPPIREISVVTRILEPGATFIASRYMAVWAYERHPGWSIPRQMPAYLVSGDSITNSGTVPLNIAWLEPG